MNNRAHQGAFRWDVPGYRKAPAGTSLFNGHELFLSGRRCDVYHIYVLKFLIDTLKNEISVKNFNDLFNLTYYHFNT